MKHSATLRTGAVAGLCALAGVTAGIAGSAAAPSHHQASARASQAQESQHRGFGIAVGFGKLGGLGGAPVHSELVVPNRAGDGFQTITSDRGSFHSLSGDQLTITEGTKTATYKTPTLTIPASAPVYRNDEKAQLSDIQSGDEVMVTKTPDGTIVTAADAQHQQKQIKVLESGPAHGPRIMTKVPLYRMAHRHQGNEPRRSDSIAGRRRRASQLAAAARGLARDPDLDTGCSVAESNA